MPQQEREEGWPLGLQPLSRRVGLIGNRDLSEPISLDTWIAGSPTSSSNYSSDSDAMSTGSSFHDRSMTLGTLLGVATNRSSAPVSATTNLQTRPSRRNHKSRAWWLGMILQARLVRSRRMSSPTTSLGQFLAGERRAGNLGTARRSVGLLCGGSADAHAEFEGNSLLGDHFPVISRTAANRSSHLAARRSVQRSRSAGCGNHVHGIPAFLSCVCSDMEHKDQDGM